MKQVGTSKASAHASAKTTTSHMSRWLQIIGLAVLAALILAAVRPWHAWRNPHPDAHGWNLFSYFTVQSNLIAVVISAFAVLALVRRKSLGLWFAFVRGAGVLYMSVTGIVYALLLENNEDASTTLGFDWKNFVLHKLAPVVILAWWLIWPSRRSISVRGACLWLIFPILWLIYTITRGVILNWYPYPFLNPHKVGGWLGVAGYTLIVCAAFVALSQGLAWISRRRTSASSLY